MFYENMPEKWLISGLECLFMGQNGGFKNVLGIFRLTRASSRRSYLAPLMQSLCDKGIKTIKSSKPHGKYDKLILKILRGTSDANISFEDLCELLRRLDFQERTRGSHHVFRKEDVEEKINFQKDADKAKPYQVRQVRSILVRHHLVGEE